MNCKNLKIRTKKTLRYIYCTRLKETIQYSNCNKCPFKVFKQYKRLQPKTEYKYKPKKGKCSRYYNNVSIMPKSVLYFIEPTNGCQKHHIFGNVANRPKSEKCGLFIWLTPEQHEYLHLHPLEMLEIKKTAQSVFMKYYNKTVDDFIELFGRSWL